MGQLSVNTQTHPSDVSVTLLTKVHLDLMVVEPTEHIAARPAGRPGSAD